jgi:hypothetical protein
MWIRSSIVTAIKEGDKIEKDVVHLSMPPTLEDRSYQTMWAFRNHNHVSSVEVHLTTQDNGTITSIFEQECVSGPNDQKPMVAKLEYVGWVEEILELNYGILNFVVLLCNWMKTNYIGSSATMKQDEYGFTIVNFGSLIPISN